MVSKSSLTITDRAKQAIADSIPENLGTDVIPGLIWKRSTVGGKRDWVVGAYERNRAESEGFRGEIIIASDLQLLIVQKDTKELVEEKILDFKDGCFRLRDS